MTRFVLFDLDGTLIDTLNLYIRSVVQTLQATGHNLLSLEEVLALRLNSEPRLMAHFYPSDEVEGAHRRFLENYRGLHASYFDGVYPGVDGLLTSLRSRGIKMGIVSGKSRGAWAITREHARLGAFDTLVFDDDVSAPKPDCEGLVKAMSNLGASPADTVYVGDSVDDLEAATAAGVSFYAALWSKSESETLAFEQAAAGIGPYEGVDHPGKVVQMVYDAGRRQGGYRPGAAL
ncbi:MAG: HAD family hydrolase [Gemmatimonadetes bacterium]|nr:HAD family hydrolase [Gemmatimonadota bacterium]MYH18098.1 HAD family hydrolase [Gemmatimonadota bacterium]MYK98199.1 HAD family hydrolase [Gemmatimonadota bacterium]